MSGRFSIQLLHTYKRFDIGNVVSYRERGKCYKYKEERE